MPLTSLRNEIHNIAMHLRVQEDEERRRRACERALRARRGIEDHFESKRLARQLEDELESFG
ncbi:PA3496 family putative envelope integrity protein [Kushneria aurantia]|uniref:PA3496 family putative envelope integrity protein n=1 Tax=Kushneria aurantia TaxID=504092 RepID=A0ABV6G0K5_9GAMM|nr:hypothetical protein [Kushneria aurantia]